MRVLVTGGAGFAGSILVPLLLSHDHQVRVVDNLMFGGDGLLAHFHDPEFEFIRGDVRDADLMKDTMRGCDAIIHLAGIVGYPACKNEPILAESVQRGGALAVGAAANRMPIIFASTQSVYGHVADKVCTEDTPTNPLSLYASSKLWAERYLLDNHRTVVLRFPTAFGMSPRMRLDLLVNDFVHKAVTDKYIVVYQPQYMRAFIHVYDMARAYLFTLRHFEKMVGQVYNVGSSDMNYTKKDLAEVVRGETECSVVYQDFDADLDKRNYTVSCAKIEWLGYSVTVGLRRGVWELARGIPVLDTKGKYANA